MSEETIDAGDRDADATDDPGDDGRTGDRADDHGRTGDRPDGTADESDAAGDRSDGTADASDATEESRTRVDDLVERYAVSDDADEAEFLAAAKLYARAVADRHDLAADVGELEWEVSKRAKRRAGVVRYTDGEPDAVALTWDHFRERGWPAAAGTVRHELAHVHLLNEAGDASHGAAFERLADELDAPLHCERFADPKFWVTCTDCGAQLPRYRRSKLVKQPEEYCCADCGGSFRVEENE